MSAPEPIRVLILEDNPSDAGLMVDALVQAGFDPRWERCDSEAGFAARLTPELDLILSDFALPQFGGLQALRLVRSRGLDVPFILVSGSIGEDIAVEAIRAGADDYLLKDRMARLGPAVRQVREKSRLRVDMKRAETALRESEAKYRELIEQASDGIFVNDQQGRILLANSRYCEMLGYTSDELLQLNVADTYPDEERTDFLKRLPQLSRVKNRLFERSMRRKDGTCFPVEISVQFTARGMHQGMVRDITERKNQEDKIARLNRIYAVLSSINSAIVRIRDLQGLFEEACAIAVEHGGFEIVWIGLLDPVTLEITPVAWAGLAAAEYLGNLKSSARVDHPRGQGVVGRAIRERRTVVSNDILTEQGTVGDRRNEAILRGYRSRIALPLLTEGNVVGAIVLFAKEKDFFTEEELKLLNELASNFSYALSHIAGMQKLEKHARIRAVSSEINAAIVRSRSKQQLFHEACRIAVEHGKFGIVWIGELDAQKLEVVPVASAGLEDSSFLMHTILSVRPDGVHGQGVLPRAVRERRPVYSNDIAVDVDIGGERRKEAVRRGYHSVIVLPLIVDGAVAGTLSMFAKELNFFDNEEVQLLVELAGNISFALESLARQEKIERLSRIRSVLGDINAAVVRLREREALLRETCRIAWERGRFEMVWIGALDQEKRLVRPVAWAGFSDETAHAVSWTTISSTKGTLGEAMLTRRPSVRNDIDTQLPGGKLRDEALARGCRSTVCLPLVVEDKVTNLITLFATGRGFFDQDEIALLNEVGANISFALESIARQEKLERLSHIRGVLGQINAAIVRVGNRQELFDEACRIAVEHCGFPMAWIGMLDPATQDLKAAAMAGSVPEYAKRLNPSVRGDIPAGQGTNGRAFREKRPIVDNDMTLNPVVGSMRAEGFKRGIRAALSLPLLVEGEAVGVMALYTTEMDYFDDEEVSLLTELAGNISFALEHMAKQKKIAKLSRIRSVLGEINAAIIRLRDRQQLFDEACRIAVEAGGFPFAWLGLVEPDAMRIKPVAWAGAEAGSLVNMQAQRSLEDKEPQGRGPSAEAVLEKKAVVVNDIQNDPRISRKNHHLERNINSLAVLPLLIADETVGVLGLHAREVGYFDEEEIKLLSELAGDIAFALQTIEKQEKLDYLAYYDALTGLPNRSLFIDRAGQQLRARGGEATMVAVVLINLDRFRNINETFGRHGGDELLKLVAQRLESAFNGRDYLARTAPDGFGVVMRGMRDAAVVAHCVESQVLECFRQPFVLNEAEIRVSARAGIAMFPADGGDADTLFKNAEAALKKAKDTGERYLFYAADMNARAALVLSLETRLRKAVELQQFVLHYQPKIHLASGAICGLEALIRWQEPGTGLVAPGIFIPVLEETGLILEAGKWVIEQALADHRAWTARGCRAPRIAVNVSAIQLQQRDFAEMVIEAVQQGGNVTAALEIEVTESLLMKDIEASIRKLSLLRGLGIHIAMDDFGTGYSSLSYIARLPINSVKIDRSFINGMGASDQDMAIVTTIVTLAHSLNLRVVAEGVETEAQSRLLKLLKCDEAQGYLFSKPVPATEIEPLLRAPREEPASHRATRERTARSAPPSPRASSAPQRVARRAIPTTRRKKRHHKT